MGFDIHCCWGLIMWRMANWPVSDGKIWCESQMLVGYSPTIPSSWHWPVDLLKVETILRSWVFYSCLFRCLSFEFIYQTISFASAPWRGNCGGGWMSLVLPWEYINVLLLVYESSMLVLTLFHGEFVCFHYWFRKIGQ